MPVFKQDIKWIEIDWRHFHVNMAFYRLEPLVGGVCAETQATKDLEGWFATHIFAVIIFVSSCSGLLFQSRIISAISWKSGSLLCELYDVAIDTERIRKYFPLSNNCLLINELIRDDEPVMPEEII